MENPFKKLSRLIPKSKKKEEEIGNITVPLEVFGGKIDLEDIKFVSFHNVPPGLSSSSGAAYTQKEFNHFFKEFLGSDEAKMEFFSKKIMGKIIVTKEHRKINISAVEFE